MTTQDKTKQLNVSMELVNEGVHFNATTDGTHPPVSIDYFPPLGNNLGYCSLELFLMSFGTCVGSTLLPFLRRMGRTIQQMHIDASGTRHEQHPTSFSVITLDIILHSPDVTEEDIDKVIGMAEEKICPVWAMVKGNVKVEINRKIIS
ncbi:MAG: OsmC family protein [Syntrophothermus sp.]